MNLELNKKYFITSDKYNFVLCQHCVYGKDSKNHGTEYIKELGYYPTLESLLQRYLDLKLKDESIVDIAGLLTAINTARKEIYELHKGVCK